MNVNSSSATWWTMYSAWSELHAAHARLSSHLATGVDPRMIAEDRSGVQRSAEHLAQRIGRLDIIL
jgi:hypothetical protein